MKSCDVDERLVAERARLRAQMTELLAVLLEREGVEPAQLSQQLGKDRSYVTRMLSGSRSVSLDAISDVFTLLNVSLNLFVDKPGVRHYPQVKVLSER